MLPSLISNLIWGASEPEENGEGVKEEEVEHSTSEEAGDWVLISCEKSKGN